MSKKYEGVGVGEGGGVWGQGRGELDGGKNLSKDEIHDEAKGLGLWCAQQQRSYKTRGTTRTLVPNNPIDQRCWHVCMLQHTGRI